MLRPNRRARSFAHCGPLIHWVRRRAKRLEPQKPNNPVLRNVGENPESEYRIPDAGILLRVDVGEETCVQCDNGKHTEGREH